jgi:C4-dicarboxylate transporter DctM subunit
MEPLTWGVVGFIAVLVLLALGIHVGLALAIVGLVGIVGMTGSISLGLGLLTTTPYSTTAVFAFTVLPLFIIMGLFATHAGMSGKAFDAAYKWVGRLPGGLAIATTWANALFGACTGSSVVACAVFTRISLPEMRKRRYDKRFACGTIAAAGMLGMLIPPSALMVIYGILTEQSIGVLLIAGIGPGILLTIVFSLGIMILTSLRPQLAPRAEIATPWRDKVRSLSGVWGIMVLVIGIIAGMYSGVFTPTEAGAAGAMGALILALLSRGLTWANFAAALHEGAQTTAMIFFILIGAMIFARFLVLTGLPNAFVGWVLQAGIPAMAIVILFLAMYLFLGMFQDSISMMSITLPVVHPIIVQLGVDPIHFAMLVVMAIEIGLLTPPVGLNVYTVRSVAAQVSEGEDVSLDDVFRGIVPFFALSLIALAVMILVPSISTLLPTAMFGR